ncbi:hypothetical protein PCL_10528 [Purpureocillium lilacinum]|uniref:Uncharacterized protein n=1 Tax=Purpureocillium lilacinum TaxID=33203 RepID=A0A2U3DQ38_PURLI|nr:hypothetical protein PCL_10528 [Purpureocillium lilacinum]
MRATGLGPTGMAMKNVTALSHCPCAREVSGSNRSTAQAVSKTFNLQPFVATNGSLLLHASPVHSATANADLSAMETSNDPDERVVYLALKRAIMGSNPEEPQLDHVTNIVEHSRDRGLVPYLVRQHGVEAVSHKALLLLQNGVFESTAVAKRRFPEVFTLPEAPSVFREQLEDGALQAETEALKEAVHKHRPEKPTGGCSSADVAMETLFPLYLPFDAQYLVAKGVGVILESVCYDFAQSHMPEVLRIRGWSCRESADLTLWAEELWTRRHDVPLSESSIEPPLGTLLASMAALWCAVVYRMHISTRLLCGFLHHAQVIVGVLGASPTASATIRKLRADTMAAATQLEEEKLCLRSTLAELLGRVAQERTEPDGKTGAMMEQMEKEDQLYQALAGWSLTQTIRRYGPSSVTTIATGTAQSSSTSGCGNDTTGGVGSPAVTIPSPIERCVFDESEA